MSASAFGAAVAAPRQATRAPARERPAVRTVAFTALALYAIVRWATLSDPAPTWRLLGLVAIAVAVASLGPIVSRRSRLLAAAVGVAAVIAAFPLSGVPLAWVAHVRIAVTADAISQGLAGLPRIFLPYTGMNQPVRMVMTMGAAVLLLDAGLLLGFAPAHLGDLRRGAVALPLLALAVIPSTLMHPSLPYLQGAVLFGLLAAFLWGERVRQGELAAMIVVCTVAAVAALLVAPALDRHRPWINPQGLAGSLAPAHLEQFDWSQRYGPLNWPRTGHAVLEVQAAHPDYWKAEDLDAFDGREWVVAAAAAPAPDPLLGVSRASLKRWTQTIRVTVGSMSTSTLIAAGTATKPVHAGTVVLPGASPGTWVTGSALGPGDSYEVTTYAPHPSPAQLQAAGGHYPSALAPYRAIDLPAPGPVGASVPVVFAPFHSAASASAPAAAAAASPYAQAYALATGLAGQAATPYQFVAAVQRYLSRGFTYDETPPRRAYPLESFLFRDRLGYCQQFAGAMALLLRMGGIPARVAAGFTAGSYDSGDHRWVATDYDAHAWVEAWFPSYGWVRFDPTPGADPARGGRTPITGTSVAGLEASTPPPPVARHAPSPSPSAAPVTPRPTASGSASGPLIAAIVVAALLAALAAVAAALRGRRPPAAVTLATELERALGRAGRPLAREMTLAGLEDRFRASPEASAYVRAIRLARFGAGAPAPTAAQRRALRAQLRAGLGLVGALRAWWALPPGWPRQPTPVAPKTSTRRRFGGIHS